MNFGELIDATNQAHRDAPVKVRTADGVEHDLTGVEIPLVDLDEGKRMGDEPEGMSRVEVMVWLTLG